MADQQQGDRHEIAGNPFRLVVVAASAGGIAALTEMLANLTGVFPAAIAIVQHRAPRAPSVLAHVLNRRSAMPVTDARDGELFRPARAYLAPADHHLLVNADGTFSLTQSAKVHGTRPAAEKLFESAAKSLKERIIAVVLSGALTTAKTACGPSRKWVDVSSPRTRKRASFSGCLRLLFRPEPWISFSRSARSHRS